MQLGYDGHMSARYDLHTHSTRSDGTTTPAAIAAEAARIGLAGFALTDHETTEGWAEARAAAANVGVAFLPGIELSTTHERFSMHLLGYGVNPESAELVTATSRVRESRRLRIREMAARLAVDFNINLIDLALDETDRTIGRPHLADALVQAGYYEHRAEAFAGALHPRAPYYVPSYEIDTVEAIRMVLDAGGVPVLAHPAARRQRHPTPIAAVERFVEAGLWGIELDHPENRPEWLPALAECAAERGLWVTGASDYHGAGKPNRLGQCTSSAETWQAIVDRAAVTQ